MDRSRSASSPIVQALVRVVERIRGAGSVDAIGYAVIAELAQVAGVRGTALVLCDATGDPALWIGSACFDPASARTYLEHASRDELAQLRATYACLVCGDVWVMPILGDRGVVGVLRVAIDAPPSVDLAMVAACISIRIAALGDTASLGALTVRQREVAELVAHGCTNAEIGRMLAISPNAVKKHVSRVLEALEVSNRTELAALTGRWKLASGNDQVLPPAVHVVVRNPAKPNATPCRAEVA